MTDTDYKSIPI